MPADKHPHKVILVNIASQADSDEPAAPRCSGATPLCSRCVLHCCALTCRRWAEGQSGSLADFFVGEGCGFLGGVLDHPGVGQDSLNGQSVIWVVLQQPSNQVFGTGSDVGLCGVSVLHLNDKDRQPAHRLKTDKLDSKECKLKWDGKGSETTALINANC